ncbi:unnamed protein product [Discula destructiva]
MGASLPLKVTLGLVMLASAIELSLISATVAYLAQIGKKSFPVLTTDPATSQQTIFDVPGLPTSLSVNQGHTSNGAAGTGLILIGCGGILALWLRGRAGYYSSALSRAVYRLWLALNVPALLLTLGALAYVFAVTDMHRGQSIDLSGVALEVGSDGVVTTTYPEGVWTPQGWFDALLGLEFVSGGERDGVVAHEKIARGWQYNLIPFFLVQLAQTAFALLDARRRRAERGAHAATHLDKEAGFGVR